MAQYYRILVDASDCPVKAEIYRLADRYGIRVALFSAAEIGAPFERWLTKVVVGDVGTVAETIIAEAAEKDFVITDDEKLAIALLGKVKSLLTTRGQRWTEDGPVPRLSPAARSSSRSRFETVLEDELKSMKKAV